LGLGTDRPSQQGLVTLALCERTLDVVGLPDLSTRLLSRNGPQRDYALGHRSIGASSSLSRRSLGKVFLAQDR
jgi:hypothetical protein